MAGYIGKVLFFMVLAAPLALALHAAGLPEWSVHTIWVAVGVIGRETLGRRIDADFERSRKDKEKES